MLIGIIMALVIGFIVAAVVATKPKLFWVLLVLFAIVGSGPMVRGYALFDEYLIGFVVFGGLLLVLIGGVHYRRNDLATNWHLKIFLWLILYLVFQSVRGMILLEDLRMIRYIVYFMMLGALSFMISCVNFPVPTARKLSLIVMWSALLYFVMYLAHGIYYERALGYMGRFVKQGELWSGSAAALFAIVVAMPAAIFSLRDNNKAHRRGALSLIAVVIITALYFDSRTALICIIGFSVVFVLTRSFRDKVKFSVFVVCFVLVFSISMPDAYSKLVEYGSGQLIALWESIIFIYSPRESDMDRNVQFYAALHTLGGNWLTLMFGEGFYSHRIAIIPSLQELGGAVSAGGLVRPTGIAAFCIDTGLVGLLLLSANMWMAVHVIIAKTRFAFKKNRPVLLFSLLMTFLWLFISNIQDMILFFLIFMPSGLLVQLSQHCIVEPTSISAKNDSLNMQGRV